MNFDLINGCFEFLGGLFICMSIARLYKDKQVRGVSPVPILFFASWGFWNLFYYPALGQWFSLAGGCFIVLCNVIWLFQMLWYIAWDGWYHPPVGEDVGAEFGMSVPDTNVISLSPGLRDELHSLPGRVENDRTTRYRWSDK